MGRWIRKYYETGRKNGNKKPKIKNPTKEKKIANDGTQDYQKQFRKSHAIKKSNQRQNHRQNKRGQSNKNHKGYRINK